MKFADIDLLSELARPDFAELRQAMHERRFVSREIIASPLFPDEEDHHPNRMAAGTVFVVREGRLRVFLAAEEKEFTLAVLEPGDLYTCHTGAFVQGLAPGSLLTCNLGVFARHMVDIPEVNQVMVRVLGNMLKSTFAIIDGLVFGDATTRLATLLLSTARDEGDRCMVHLDMTIEQLAQHIGSTRQTVSTLLNDMIRSRILHREKRGVYEILDTLRLEEMKR